MNRKIIGVTVGSPLPKPNLMQTDPTKGDYVKGKDDFIKQLPSGSGVYILADGETIADAPNDADVVIDPNGDVDLDIGGGNSGIYTLADGETFDDVPDDVDMVIDPNIEADDISELVQAIIAELPDSGINVTGAEVGQTIVVKAVDENGVPTEWECAELPNDWEVIADITTEEEVTSLRIESDTEGNPFELQEVEISIITGTLPKQVTWWVGNGVESASLGLAAHSFRIVIRHNCLNRGATATIHDTWGTKSCDVFYQWESPCIRFTMSNYDGGTLPVGTLVRIVGRRKKA